MGQIARRIPRPLRDLGSRIASNLRDPATVLLLVLIGALVVRLMWLDLPRRSLIFDEAYYVNAARVILGWPVTPGAHYADSPPFLDPNAEHPPLGKLVIAGSMALFGNTGLAWRLPSVVAGLIGLLAVYGICRRSGALGWLPVLVVGLLAFENLTLVHSRIATLDMLALAPVLVASWLALRRRWVLAGAAIAVGLLMKLTAIYGLGAILLLHVLLHGGIWWRTRRIPRRDVVGPAVFVVVALGLAVAGLAVLDARFTTFASPLDHIRRMVEYGANLRAPLTSVGFCPEADSRPWQWLFNECQIQYLRVDVTTRAGETIVSSVPRIDFRGALNPLLAGAIPLSMLFVAWHAWRTRHRLALWAIAWGAANYLPYLVLAVLTNRIMYIYYFLPALPAVVVAVALLLTRANLPTPVRWGYVAAYGLGFLAYFPFRQPP